MQILLASTERKAKESTLNSSNVTFTCIYQLLVHSRKSNKIVISNSQSKLLTLFSSGCALRHWLQRTHAVERHYLNCTEKYVELSELFENFSQRYQYLTYFNARNIFFLHYYRKAANIYCYVKAANSSSMFQQIKSVPGFKIVINHHLVTSFSTLAYDESFIILNGKQCCLFREMLSMGLIRTWSCSV